jgi:membrane-associated PAP2 superfamily phosphatase/protein-S-isoprenylcysteine O-methyltransferase Ste14
MSKPASMHYQNPLFYILTQVLGLTVLFGWLAYTVQQSAVDMGVTRSFYDASGHGFPWRHQAFVDAMGQFVVWLLPVGSALFCGGAAMLSYRAKAIASARSVLWALFAAFCLIPLLAGGLKHYTALPRPFSLAVFGGYVDLPSGFWAAAHQPGGGALPSVHAAVGFSVLALYFAGWALGNGRMRWLGLAGGLLLGSFFGALRIMQGAHFLSQVMWSLAFVWCVCSVLFYPLIVTRHRSAPDEIHSLHLDDIWKHLSIVQVRRRNTLTMYGVLLACWLPFLSSTWPAESWVHLGVEWAGLGLILLAISGRCWCILYLGGHKGAELIDQGPYSVSRNPLYVFSMLAVAGIGAQSGSLLLGPILALFVYAVFNNVIDEEERLLRKVFGQGYADYCRRVPRFGPRLSGWQSQEQLLISVSGLWSTIRDAAPYLLALPLFELIEWGQAHGWFPVLIRLP